jgi:hypothetical protein
MFKYTVLFFLNSSVIFAQSNFHPESTNLGCCSEKTRNEYTYDPANAKEYFQIYEANKISEKSIFYEGKFDPWKAPANKKNALFNQVYIIPPGTLPIGKGVFLDQTEVANIHFLEFLFYVEKDSGRYMDAKYEPRLENKFKNKYLNNVEFYFYPVIGVNHEKAQTYCNWRAQMVNQKLEMWLEDNPKKYKYAGRLPSLSEWKKAAGIAKEHVKDVHYNIGKNQIKYFQEEIVPNRFSTPAVLETKEVYAFNANFYVDPPIGIEIEIPFYIYSYEPNIKGFYNLYGNVKEILFDGNAVGGSFKTPYEQDKLFEPDDTQDYRTDVGFRCIIEIARRK